jgi:hypothetical protein
LLRPDSPLSFASFKRFLLKLLSSFSLADVEVPKNLLVPVTSDKGLCGGINSTVVKYTRQVNNVVNLEQGELCSIDLNLKVPLSSFLCVPEEPTLLETFS